MSKELGHGFSKRYLKAKKHTERWQYRYLLGGIQVKGTLNKSLTLHRMTTIKKNKKIQSAEKNMETIGTPVQCWEDCKMITLPWKQHNVSSED